MPNIHRVRVALTGLPGLPGVSTFYATNGPDLQDPLHDFYDAIAGSLPTGLTVQVEPSGDVIDVATGTLTGTWNGASIPPVACVGTGVYAAPAGAAISWLTNTVIDGRKLRGRTYMVPLVSAEYQTDGSLRPAFLTTLTSVVASLLTATSSNFQVWGRPREFRAATGTLPELAARNGAAAAVAAADFKDKVAILRSRRD